MKKIVIFLLFLILMKYSLFSAPAGWDNTVTIAEKNAFRPAVIFSYNNLFAVYEKNKNIFFIRSTNEGAEWFDEKKITADSGEPKDPLILFMNSHIYIFWIESRNGQNEIYFTHSEDPFGEKFVKESRLTLNTGNILNLTAAATGDKIVLVWSDNSTGNYELYVKNYDPVNDKKNDPVQITKSASGSFYPCMAFLMDEFFLLWQQRQGTNYKIMYSKSADALDWSEPVTLSGGFINAYTPCAAINQEGFIAGFQGEMDFQQDIYISSFNILEETSSIPLKVSRQLNIERFPRIISSLKALYLFWEEGSSGYKEIVYKMSTDNGLTWGPSVNLTQTEKNSGNFNAVYNSINDSIYLVWEEGPNNKICFKKTDSFCPAPDITETSHKENEWSMKKDVELKWKSGTDASGIKEFAYIMDHEPETIPELYQKEYPVNTAHFYDLDDGIWYFHLNARDHAGNTSKTVHYQIMINSRIYADKEEYHIVKQGDTLWNISKKFFNEPAHYKIIADYNNILDPELIYPHQILKIPPDDIFKKK